MNSWIPKESISKSNPLEWDINAINHINHKALGKMSNLYECICILREPLKDFQIFVIFITTYYWSSSLRV